MTVYVIGERASGVVKIGFTAHDPITRLLDMQTGSPVKLVLRGAWPGDRDTERQLHRHFKARRLHGEWFDFDGEDPIMAVAWALWESPAEAHWLSGRPPRRMSPDTLDIPVPRIEPYIADDRFFPIPRPHRAINPRSGKQSVMDNVLEPYIAAVTEGHEYLRRLELPLWWWRTYVAETGWNDATLTAEDLASWCERWNRSVAHAFANAAVRLFTILRGADVEGDYNDLLQESLANPREQPPPVYVQAGAACARPIGA